MECIQHFLMRLAIEIHLVQDNCHRYVIDLAGHQDTVQERKLDFGIIDGSDDECAVEIGRYDMGLTGKIGRFADDIIFPWRDRGDGGRILQCKELEAYSCTILRTDLSVLTERFLRHFCLKRDNISHSHRICSRAAFQSDLTSEHCREKIPVRKLSQKIVASRMLYNRRLSFNRHRYKLFEVQR